MKKITILNGITDDKYLEFEKDLEEFCTKNEERFCINYFTLREMNIKYCCGCWSCWSKTPGECSQKDEMPEILRSVIQSDMTVFISPIVMGFVSAQIKKINDKMIPLVHPYIGIYENELHHKKRYRKYPKLGLMLLEDRDKETAVETAVNDDATIITDIYKRMAINLKTQLAFSVLSKSNMEVLVDEINRI